MEIEVKREDYVDINDALNRIGGNMALYKKLLGRFVEGNHFETLSAAALSGDMDEAARLAHTLKGVSANLSLVSIRSITTSMEHSFKEGSDFTTQLAALEQAYNTTMEIVSEIIG